MTLQLNTELGAIHVTDHCIAVLAGSAAMDCYGLVGMASRKGLKDGIAELLGRENMSRGVEVRREHDKLHIDLHIIVSYGTKISEVAHNIQSKVTYVLNSVIGLQVDEVHIFVQDVRVSR
ncbi:MULTISPECIES: Asp23/Gls24 family envelope stress response protein [Paenibacillus]|uniref:Asp23/Gls24 family envelope stress response protein n=1 Tax=Paenibacillus paeoniae TaxID=2292705 RepID=A0A371PJL8_9BACL|nr:MULTISPECIES: Asp23/Gls24 family envelope stress response protein [Paenibacillus]REK76402.1 Asp23/Gls24 family envelope stress response protein [Paenibacillus paeoniae]RJE90547.1 Asp23/Gls24 family envelope stress response protein [Paenibacillus sp. 1011MAR3C5]